MGQDIAESRFSQADFNEFQARLAAETDLLTDWFEEGRFADTPAEGDSSSRPAWSIGAISHQPH